MALAISVAMVLNEQSSFVVLVKYSERRRSSPTTIKSLYNEKNAGVFMSKYISSKISPSKHDTKVIRIHLLFAFTVN